MPIKQFHKLCNAFWHRDGNGGSKPLRAEIVGSNRCTMPGFVATSGQAPVLALCRELIGAGFDPATPLACYRGDRLALRVRSIGEAARVTVEDNRLGQPRFRRWRDRPASDGAAPPIAAIAPTGAGARGQTMTAPKPSLPRMSEQFVIRKMLAKARDRIAEEATR